MLIAKEKSLLEKWRNRKKKSNPEDVPIVPLKGTTAPLSLGQKRLWFLQQLYPKNPFYHYADAFRFKGYLNIELLIQSFEIIAQRHDVLRTTFEISDGQPIQKIQENSQIEFEVKDFSEYEGDKTEQAINELSVKSAQAPLDLETGPLTRILILKITDTDTLLVLNMHHIVTDKWSMKILRDELATIYKSLIAKKQPDFPPLPVQYADFSHWQTTQKINESDLQYWEKKLSGELPVLNLPTDRTRPSIPSYKGAYHRNTLSVSLSEDLKNLAKRLQVTPFILLITVYKILLYKYTNQEDILIGTPIMNRHKTNLENVIGFYNDTIVLRSAINHNVTFTDFLNQVKTTTLEAFSHKNTPFEALVKRLKPPRQLSIHPIFQSMFLFHSIPPTPSFGDELEVKYWPLDFGVCKFDLTLYTEDTGAQFSTIFEYSRDLFDRATVLRMLSHYQTLLEHIVKNPDTLISELPILPETEQNLVLQDWNQTKTDLPNLPNIHFQIEKQVSQNPDAAALVFENQQLTYHQLNEKAEKIAAYLHKSGVSKNAVVGLCTERSAELIIGMFGILKAGGAYLPLDPEYPSERIDFMVKDASVDIILTQEHLIDNFFDSNATVLGINEILRSAKENRAEVAVEKSDLAYLIYTSGSTGQPKAVGVTHQNLIHSTMSRFEFYPQSPNAFLLMSSFAFDSSIVGIFWTLCSGGTLVIPKHRIEQNLEALGDLIQKQGITHTLLLPSLYSVFLQNIPTEKLKSLNTVIVAGEACTASVCEAHFEKFLQNVSLYNEYGPTEASVWCTAHRIEPEDVKGQIPIGKPISNTQNYILDSNLKPVPIGIAGELYIGGDGVTKGYWNRPELTAERFVPNPFGGSEKLYRTGDLARWRADGIIEFLGRADNQVKIRGYRIELEEIRKVILQQEDVEEALVIFQKETLVSTADLDEIERLTELLLNLDTTEAEQLLDSVESLSDESLEILLESNSEI